MLTLLKLKSASTLNRHSEQYLLSLDTRHTEIEFILSLNSRSKGKKTPN